jgi:hypothetical protein
MNTEVVKHETQKKELSIFSSDSFAHSQRIAQMLSTSELVPKSYQGNVANTLVAMEMANRMGESPLAVMQNMNVIHGKPSWSSTFIIALINSSGRFTPLRFKYEGEGDNLSCKAVSKDSSGETIEGPPCSIGMAKKQGWYAKAGSKWPDMPDLMLSYRAAAFFGRLYAPDLMMGMRTEDEVLDIGHVEITTPELKKPELKIEEPAVVIQPAVEKPKKQKVAEPIIEIPTSNNEDLI